MATQADESATNLNAQLVANAFVEQYYTMLSQCPKHVHKFYNESSIVSRLDPDGSMSSVSTLDDIDKMILAMDYENHVVEILSADAQESFGGGVIVLVTGFFSASDNIRRKFTQIFFLAPQEKGGYFVLNDVLRYTDEELADIKITDNNNIEPTASESPDPEPAVVTDRSVLDQDDTPTEDGNQATEATESSSPLADVNFLSAEKELVTDSVGGSKNDSCPVSVGTSENDVHPVSETSVQQEATVSGIQQDATVSSIQQDAAVSSVPQDAPKRSYASVANELNFKKEPFLQRISPAKPVEQRRPAAPRVAAPIVTTSNGVEKKNNNNTAVAVKGYSIFVANLPMDATVEQLIEVFGKYGPIKPNGVQVRSYKQEKNCFGFVEFESADSMQKAIEDGSIMIGDRSANIEAKKANNDGGGKFRKGGFRSDSFKSRGGRGYGRGDSLENQGGFSGQGRGFAGRPGEPTQKVNENGKERGPPRQIQQPGSS